MLEIYKRNESYFFQVVFEKENKEIINFQDCIRFNIKTKTITKTKTNNSIGSKKIQEFELVFNKELQEVIFSKFSKAFKKLKENECKYSKIGKTFIYALIVSEELKKIKERLNTYL